MIAEFKLPDLGEGLTESEIVSWNVSVGDTVTLNQILGEVETAKALVELPSPYAGTITAIKHPPGTVVEVGEVIVAFEVPQAAAAPKRVPTLVGYGADPESSGRPVRRARAVGAAPTAPATDAAEPAQPRHAGTDRPRSTPPVRKLARDLGIDLSQLSGSGERGLITRADVDAYARQHSSAGHSGAEPSGAGSATVEHGAARQERIPIKGVQKSMARAMVQSAFTAPHVTEFLTVDVTRGLAFLSRLRAQRGFDGTRLTPLTLAAKAVILALPRHPELNSSWDQDAQEIVRYNYVNLGIAAATPRGLLVPTIKDAHTLGLRALAGALNVLADRARAGKTSPEELSGGTFSITNIGVFGIDAGTPILNPGEAGILALGNVRRIPWEHKGRVALRQVMTLSLSFDHRLVDGQAGSQFLAEVGAVLADPAMVLALD